MIVLNMLQLNVSGVTNLWLGHLLLLPIQLNVLRMFCKIYECHIDNFFLVFNGTVYNNFICVNAFNSTSVLDMESISYILTNFQLQF